MPIATHSMDESMERPISRFVIGIDLGTTNCAVAYVDTLHATPTVETFRIEQLVDWSSVESRDTLPSFHYQLTDQEANSVQNRWIDRGSNSATNPSNSVQPSIVGALARDRGLEIPGRQISSAKSWLCHSGVDRTAAFLPWHGDEGVELLSPVEASASYLRYLRHAWDRAFSAYPMADQDVVVTLPASFDEVARELTVEAAKLAGLPRIVLLEEPQAAFYAWLCRHGEDWTNKIAAGKTILVCDIGGGTTDFTLIRVKSEALASEVPDANSTKNLSTVETTQRLHRVAVGEHLILGGDNLDLALARAAELKLVGNDQSRLPSRDWDALRQHCRVAKELLLGSSAPQQHIITLVGSGSRLLSQTKTVTIDQEIIQKVLLDGFFPLVSINEQPSQAASGFQEFGLPYASDPAITKHLAAFLWSHRFAGRDSDECQKLGDLQAARPDVILFNGGVLESSQIRERILEQIRYWFASTIDPQWKVEELKGNRLDLAVAQGAAYFGQVRRGIGVRIDASLARSYYMQVAASPKAICLVPGDAVAGDRFRLDQHPFSLTLGEPVQFPLWYSSIRLADQVGEIVDIDDQQMKPLPIIQTVLELKRSRKSDQVPVFIDAELTEIGTLQLACALQDGEHRWKLDFDVRSTVETDRIAHQGQGEQLGIVDEQAIETAQSVIASVFGESATVDPKDLAKRLSERLEMPKNSWPPSLLRAIWASLIEYDESRGKSPSHESRWLNLLGFCLRPGYGFAADDWRVATSWRRVQGKLNIAEQVRPPRQSSCGGESQVDLQQANKRLCIKTCCRAFAPFWPTTPNHL